MRVGGVSHWGGRRYLEGWEAVALSGASDVRTKDKTGLRPAIQAFTLDDPPNKVCIDIAVFESQGGLENFNPAPTKKWKIERKLRTLSTPPI